VKSKKKSLHLDYFATDEMTIKVSRSFKHFNIIAITLSGYQRCMSVSSIFPRC